MERRTILVEGMGAPKRVVQQIQTRPRTTPICPLCKKRFKKNDPTVLVDLVKRIRLTPEKNRESEITVRIQICESCAQPVIEHKQKVMDDLISVVPRPSVNVWHVPCAKRLRGSRRVIFAATVLRLRTATVT